MGNSVSVTIQAHQHAPGQCLTFFRLKLIMHRGLRGVQPRGGILSPRLTGDGSVVGVVRAIVRAQFSKLKHIEVGRAKGFRAPEICAGDR